jgi:hypothetical protein
MRMDHLQRQLRNNQNASIGDCCQERERDIFVCMLFTPLMRARLKGLNRVELVDPHLICFNTLRLARTGSFHPLLARRLVLYICCLYGRGALSACRFISHLSGLNVFADVTPRKLPLSFPHRNDTFHIFVHYEK